MVGVLLIINKEAFASTATLLKVNLAIRSFWAAGLIIVKPQTDQMTMLRLKGENIPLDDISFVAAEVNRAFTKMGALL